MGNINNFIYVNFDYIILTIIIIFTIIIVTNILDIDFNFSKNSNIQEEFKNSFCKKYEDNHIKLNNKSKDLSYGVCNSTRCTVWVNNSDGGKCHGGNSEGPNLKGSAKKPLEIYNYFYKNKCNPVTKSC